MTFEKLNLIFTLAKLINPNVEMYEWAGKKHFVPLSQSEVRTRDHRLSIQAALITAPGPPPSDGHKHL